MKNKYVLPITMGLVTVTSLSPVSVFAEEKDVPVNITVEATPINVTLPTSIELANVSDSIDITVASTNKITNNANTGTVYIDSINLETLNGWSLGNKTAKYGEMAKDSKNLYLGVKLSDETDFTNLKESYAPTNKEIGAKSERGLLFEGKTNIASSKLVSQVGNLVVTVSGSETVVQNGNLKNGFLTMADKRSISEISFVTTQEDINTSTSRDVSVEGDGSVMAWTDANNPKKMTIGAKNGKVMAPKDSSKMFYDMQGMQSIDVTNLDVSNVENMASMFITNNPRGIEIIGLGTWNTSNVTNMGGMFKNVGKLPLDVSNWDVSNVTNMGSMFSYATLGNEPFDVSNWNVSKVTDMGNMFAYAGSSGTTFVIHGLSNWDVSNVINMSNMFLQTCPKATTFDIGNLENWNVSNVARKDTVFNQTGAAASFVPPSWAK